MAAAKAEAASEMDLLSNCMMHSFHGLRLVGKCSCVARPSRRPDADGTISDAPLWRRSHVDGLEIHGGFDAKPVEVHVEPLPCPVATDVVQPGQEFQLASSLLATP